MSRPTNSDQVTVAIDFDELTTSVTSSLSKRTNPLRKVPVRVEMKEDFDGQHQ